MPESSDFGARLRQARESAGLTQTELAKRVGMAQSSLADAERAGHSVRKLAEIAKVTGVKAEWIASGMGPMRDELTPDALEFARQFSRLTEPEKRKWVALMLIVSNGATDEEVRAAMPITRRDKHEAGEK